MALKGSNCYEIVVGVSCKHLGLFCAHHSPISLPEQNCPRVDVEMSVSRVFGSPNEDLDEGKTNVQMFMYVYNFRFALSIVCFALYPVSLVCICDS